MRGIINVDKLEKAKELRYFKCRRIGFSNSFYTFTDAWTEYYEFFENKSNYIQKKKLYRI